MWESDDGSGCQDGFIDININLDTTPTPEKTNTHYEKDQPLTYLAI